MKNKRKKIMTGMMPALSLMKVQAKESYVLSDAAVV